MQHIGELNTIKKEFPKEPIKIIRKLIISKERRFVQLEEKYRQALEEVLQNLRSIECPNEADSYIDDSIKIITEVLKDGQVKGIASK